MSYKNILVTEIHLYCYWKMNDNTLKDNINNTFLSRVTLESRTIGKGSLLGAVFGPHSSS